jgi:hypothetical protein
MNWLGAIYSEDKLPPRVQSSGIGSWAVRAGETADLRLRYYEDVDLKNAAKTLEALGVHIIQLNEDLLQFTANVPLNRLAELAAMDWVRWIEEVPPPPTPFNDGSRANVQANAVQTRPTIFPAPGSWSVSLTSGMSIRDMAILPAELSSRIAATPW